MVKTFNDIWDKKVFLGGTCNNSTWRDTIIQKLKIKYFNPVVDDWTEEAYEEELVQRELCDFCLYVISPLMTGVYSIAEVVDDSNKRPEKTIFCVIEEDRQPDSEWVQFTQGQLKSLGQVKKMVEDNGANVYDTLEEVAEFLNLSGDSSNE